MPSTIIYNRGDIVLVAFPFTDLSATKQRPALVLSTNVSTPDVLVAAITSQVAAALAADEFALPNSDLRVCGLPKASIIRLMKLVSLHEQLVIKRIGRMPATTLDAVLTQIRGIFS